jgi:hypothetical protein
MPGVPSGVMTGALQQPSLLNLLNAIQQRLLMLSPNGNDAGSAGAMNRKPPMQRQAMQQPRQGSWQQPTEPVGPFPHGPLVGKRVRRIIEAINQRKKLTERLPGPMRPAQEPRQPSVSQIGRSVPSDWNNGKR